MLRRSRYSSITEGKYKHARIFPPAEGSPEREGWDKCISTPPNKRKEILPEIVKRLTGSESRFEKGWMDAWQTFGDDSWKEIKRRMPDPNGKISEDRIGTEGYLFEKEENTYVGFDKFSRVERALRKDDSGVSMSVTRKLAVALVLLWMLKQDEYSGDYIEGDEEVYPHVEKAIEMLKKSVSGSLRSASLAHAKRLATKIEKLIFKIR